MKRPLKISLLVLTCIAAVGGLLWMRSLASWRPVKIGQVSHSYSVSLSEDGQTALLMTDDLQYGSILDLRTGSETAWPENARNGFILSVKSPERAFVIDEKAGKNGYEMYAYDVKSGRLVRTFSIPVSFKSDSPDIWLPEDEKTVFVVDLHQLFQWEIESGKLLRQVKLEKPFFPSPNFRTRFAVSLDGKQLIGCAGGQGRIWSIPSGKVITSWKMKAGLTPISFSPDARVVVYFPRSYQSIYRFVDTSTGNVGWTLTGTLIDRFSDSGHEMVFLTKTGCDIRDALTGTIKLRLSVPRQSDGSILRVTSDTIYTRNDAGDIYRWRTR